MSIAYVETPLLKMAYESGGPEGGRPLILLHGWPDDARTWARVAPELHEAGFRTFAPYLRGCGPTRFLSADTKRSGDMGDLMHDVLAFADALELGKFVAVGHDWGARIAHLLGGHHGNRATRIVAMSVGYHPGDPPTPPNEQAQAYWYQWFMATERGAERVRTSGVAFARHMWETWGPPGWFSELDFADAAKSFENPDWADITIDSYRVRWEPKGRSAPDIDVPTLMIQGGADRVALPSSSEGKERFFTKGYRREVLPGVGHFPTREAPAEVARLIVDFLRE